MIQEFELIGKKQLTHDVYELDFRCEKHFNFKAGQFVTFLIEVGGRAYSILEENGTELRLIIKKRELESGGRGGSKYLCELNIGEKVKGIGPAGHFLLRETINNKLFLGTGTGFVPLYNQIISGLKKDINCDFKLIFGARSKKDLFYIDILDKLKEKYSNFDYEIFLSNEKDDNFKHGYVTSYINQETIKNFSEAYICGIPVMIDSAKDILKENGIIEENIFTEKY